MKTFFRIFTACVVVFLVLLLGGYFLLTNPGVQKSLIESRLPEGSSIQSIHVTKKRITLSNLFLMLSDGTRVKVGAVDTAFEPLAIIFGRTIKMGVLQVEGLRVDLSVVSEGAPSGVRIADSGKSSVEVASKSKPSMEAGKNPIEMLYALGDFDWLFNIDGIAIEGTVYNGKNSQYIVQIDSQAIRPGEISKIDASLKLLSDLPLPSGLKSFDSTATLSFKQKENGGFESLRLKSNTLGQDTRGNHLISLSQNLDLLVDDIAGSATISAVFNADLPKPQILAPELTTLGALKMSGNVVVSTDGVQTTLSSANVKASSGGSEMLTLDLKRSMVFGGIQEFSGNLLNVSLTNMPLEWLNPWLPDDMRIESQVPLSLSLNIAGAPNGEFVGTFAKPVKLGPLTLVSADKPLLQDVTGLLAPEFRFDAAGVSSLSMAFDANLPNPQLLAPELRLLDALKLKGNVVASTDGIVTRLSSGNLKAFVSGSEILALNLKRSIVLGETQKLSGDLLDLIVTKLPLEWLNPWLPDSMWIESQVPVSLSLAIAGAPNGAFVITSEKPIRIGPLTMISADELLLKNVTFLLTPEFEFRTDQSLRYIFNSLSVANKSGAFIQGASSGVIRPDVKRSSANPFAGVQLQAKFQIGLQEAFNLPALAGRTSIASGQLALDLEVDDSSDTPFQLETRIKGLSANNMPAVTKDYSATLRLKSTKNLGEWGIKGNAFAGSVSRPSSNLQFVGAANLIQNPVKYWLNISSPFIAQEDVSILSAAFMPTEQSSVSVSSNPNNSNNQNVSKSPHSSVGVFDSSESAPSAVWSMFEGRTSLRVDEFRLEAGQIIKAIDLQANVSSPQLTMDLSSAKIGKGELRGSSVMLYQLSQLKPYSFTGEFSFFNIDPAFFAKKNQKSLSIQGQFDGIFEVVGMGESVSTAIEDSTAKLKITGQNGTLTAFDLDGYKEVGFGIIRDLLGKNSNPRIVAFSSAIPYFKDIRFDNFVFELTRGADKQILIPQLRLTGDNILLDAVGSVGASALSEFMSQPLDLKVLLGAKGQLMEHLEILQLLQPTVGEDGFKRWNKDVRITGTLSNPNSDQLREVLFGAAKKAFSEPKKKAETSSMSDSVNKLPTENTQAELSPQTNDTGNEQLMPDSTEKKSKEERRLDDIQTGLDILNSILSK